jgi:hypothetical protein
MKPGIGGAAKYQRDPDYIVSFLKTKIINSNELPESRFSLDLGIFHY